MTNFLTQPNTPSATSVPSELLQAVHSPLNFTEVILDGGTLAGWEQIPHALTVSWHPASLRTGESIIITREDLKVDPTTREMIGALVAEEGVDPSSLEFRLPRMRVAYVNPQSETLACRFFPVSEDRVIIVVQSRSSPDLLSVQIVKKDTPDQQFVLKLDTAGMIEVVPSE